MPPLPGLSPVAGKAIIARFDGGQIFSDAGVLVMPEVEQWLGVAECLAPGIDDPRLPERVRHGVADILRFRMLIMWTASSVTMSRTRCAGCPSGTNSCTEGGSSQTSSTFHGRKLFIMPPSESLRAVSVDLFQPLTGRAPSPESYAAPATVPDFSASAAPWPRFAGYARG